MGLTSELLERLERHYIKPGAPLPGGIFVPEVGSNGDWGAGSRCDAIYVGFTSTSGRLMVGHELKVSRSDWQHELDQSGKADAWHDACHEWWVVAPSTTIVDPDTLPVGWGLMVPSKRTTTRMDKVVKAARRPDLTPPWWAVRSVMARQDTLRDQAIRKAKDKAEREMYAEVERRMAEHARQGSGAALTYQQTEDLRVAEEFRTAGVRLTRVRGFDNDEIGPQDLAALLPLIVQHRNAAQVRNHLAKGYGSARDVLRLAQELVRAVDAMGITPAEAVAS